ncbi:unnamed protein product [Mucor circinelloides]
MTIDTGDMKIKPKLPFEVLQGIFSKLVSHGLYRDEADVKTLHECQLVCREWRLPAQEAFYKNIRLGESGSSFASIIKHATELGKSVEIVNFSIGFASCWNTNEILEIINRCCPNILILSCSSSLEQGLVLSYIASHKLRFEKLKIFAIDGMETLSMYKRIVMEHKNTLTSLSISSKNPGYQILLQHLKRFASLATLYLFKTSFSGLQEFNKMIDDIPSVCSMGFYDLDLSNCTDMINDTIPNRMIRKINIKENAKFSTQSLRYFGQKFQALHQMNAEQIIGPDGTEIEESSWWDQLGRIYSSFKQYQLGMVLSNSTNMNQIQKCIDLVMATTGKTNEREFTLAMNPGWFGDDKINATLSKTSDFYSITFDISLFADVNVDDILDFVHRYLPKVVNIRGIEHVSFLYEKLALERPVLELSSIEAIIGHIEKFCIRDNWAIFDKAITAFGQLEESKMHLSKFVLCKEPFSSQPLYLDFKAPELRIKDSIFYEGTLPQFSLRLPKVNKLILDTCSFLKTNTYSLKIFLPTTQVHSFGLRITPFINATFWNMYGLYKYDGSCLEDFELLRAISSNGKYTLKIETDTKVYLSMRQGGKIIQQDCTDITEGTKENFLIWIKCKDMKEFAITSEGDSLFSWDPISEPLV